MSQPTEKQCSKCLAFKPLGEFGNDKSRKDGKMPACRCCNNESQRQYRAANPEKDSEYSRKYYAANPEKGKEAQRQYRAANREKINESDRKWKAANREKDRESSRQSRTARRHARNQCSVFNAQDPKKWELLQSKLKALDSTKTKEKE
jgi:hypothetical protein